MVHVHGMVGTWGHWDAENMGGKGTPWLWGHQEDGDHKDNTYGTCKRVAAARAVY